MRRFGFGLAICALGAGPGSAQDVEGQVTLSLAVFDAVALIAPPPWVADTDGLAGTQVFRNGGPSGNGTELFVQEFIPEGQPADDWRELYALSAESPLDGSLENYVQGQITAFARACATVDAARVTEAVVMIACSAYDTRPELGEIGLFQFQKLGSTVVKNYYEVRVPAFDPDTWEDVAEGVPGLATAIERLERFRLTAAAE